MIKMKKYLWMLVGTTFLFGCSQEKSKTTGWNYNDPSHGGFEVSNKFTEQNTPPGMVFVEGGSYTMGRVEQDVRYDWNNVPKSVTVSSFYLDETEVRNVDYLEYLFWLERVYGSNYDNGSYPEVYWNALPDTNVWRDKLGFNEPLVEHYLRHPAYHLYPVVGVSWEQAADYCAWRTDRVNERILIDNGYLWEDPDQIDDNVFTTDSYLMGQYEGRIRRKLPNLKQGVHDYSKKAGRDREAVRVVQERDGILFPAFRLPTEAEWEYAALGLVENTDAENVDERRLYPWDGDGVRNAGNKNKGEIVANFKRGRGDNMGIASKLNDQGDIPVPTRTYWPNAFGLYNMAGNVSEWVMDVYRPLIDQTTTDLNPYRGNVYQTWTRDEDRFLIEKDSLGQMIKRNVTVEENMGRRNYSSSDNINFEDGDYDSQLKTDDWLNDQQTNTTNDMYEFGTKSLITDNSRVYKGGSWNDRAYWMVPGTRRFLNQSLSTATIGFRCAMDRLGPPVSQLKENQRKPVDWERRKGY
jgi:gliding motility-associated lipoprotein GldJ